MKYRELTFIPDAQELLRELDVLRPEQMIERLLRDYVTDAEFRPVFDRPPWGESDFVIYHGKYVLSFNEKLGYVSLTELIPEKA